MVLTLGPELKGIVRRRFTTLSLTAIRKTIWHITERAKSLLSIVYFCASDFVIFLKTNYVHYFTVIFQSYIFGYDVH